MPEYLTTEPHFEKIFNSFMAEMRDWESEYFQKSVDSFHTEGNSRLDADMRSELLKIFQCYVLEGNRNYDRLENLACRSPSDYDQKNAKIKLMKMNKNKYVVTVEKLDGLTSLFRLTFVNKHGGFRLSKRELHDGKNWCRIYV